MATPIVGDTIRDLLIPDRMIANLPGFVYVCAHDESWTMQFLSSGVEAILGYSPGDLIGNRVVAFADLIHPEDRARITTAANATLAAREPFESEYRIRTASGETKWVWERSHCIFDHAGNVVCIEGYIEDISAYREANRLARLNECRYKDAQRSAKVGSWEFSIDQDWWSDEMYSILGEDRATCTPSFGAFLNRVHVDDRPRTVDAKERLEARGGGHAVLDFRIVTPGGREKIVHCQLEATFDPAENGAIFNGSIQDITERAELEREVVAVSEQERTRIGHDLHDDLGQELTALSFGLRVLTDELNGEHHRLAQPARELLEIAQNSISKTRRLARSLAPGAPGNLSLELALDALTHEVSEYSDVGCRLESTIRHDPCPPETVTQLYRIAQEAVNNALRHSGARNIEICYYKRGNTGCMEVRDDGIGIPPERERAEGFGLRSMRYRARMINGSLEVQAVDTGGTVVSCTFALPEALRA